MAKTAGKTLILKPSPVMSAIGSVAHQNNIRENKKRADAIANNSWDEVQGLNQLCTQLIMSGMGLIPALSNKRLREQIEDTTSLNQEVQILVRDLRKFSDNLLALRKRHENKTGSATTPDENMEAIGLFTEYAMWTEQFEAIVQPGINHIVEIIQKAEAKLMDIDSQAAEDMALQTQQVLDAVAGKVSPVEAQPDSAAGNPESTDQSPVESTSTPEDSQSI